MFHPDSGVFLKNCAPHKNLVQNQAQCEELCGGRELPDCLPRAHFDNFFQSSVVVFQILTGENWNTVLLDGLKAVGPFASVRDPVLCPRLVVPRNQLIILSGSHIVPDHSSRIVTLQHDVQYVCPVLQDVS